MKNIFRKIILFIFLLLSSNAIFTGFYTNDVWLKIQNLSLGFGVLVLGIITVFKLRDKK